MKILIDFREKNSLVPSELIHLGCEIEFQTLKVGDYLIGNTCIERKTISDFISSMINKHLFNQLIELKQYEKRLLIIEGIKEKELYEDNSEGMNANAIRGMLLSISLESCPIILTKNSEDTAKFLNLIRKREESSPKEVSLNPKKRNLSFQEQKQYILESFPGVGPASAKKLLEKFKSLKEIANASEEEIKEILGKKSVYFRWVFDN
jgi:ERCC4-type nuclease